jgi:hypothetical protein
MIIQSIIERCDFLGLEFVPFVVLLLDFVLILSICATLLKMIGYEFRRSAETFLAVGITFLSCVVLTTNILGIFYLLSWQNLLIFHSVFWVLLHFFVARQNGQRRYLEAFASLRMLSMAVLAPVIPLFQKYSWNKQKLYESLIILCIFVILVFYFIPALFTLPLNYDSNTYRLSRIAYWLQEKNIFHFATNDIRQNYMAINCDLVMLWITSFFHKGFPLVHLVQFFGGLLCCAATYAIGRSIGFTKLWSLAAVLFFLGIPNAAAQFFTSQTDLFTTGCLMAGLFFMYKALADRRLIFFALFGSGLGLAVGAKGTIFFWGPGLLFLFLCQLAINRPQWQTFCKSMLCAVGLALILGGFNYAQNLQNFGNPFAPSKLVRNLHSNEYDFSIAKSCFLRGSAYFWQIFEPSSNLPLLHPLTTSTLRSMENIILRNTERSNSLFFYKFKRATKWVRKLKVNEDFLSFGFLVVFTTVVSGFTAIFSAFRSKNIIAAQIAFMFISIILYMFYFSYVQGWTVHKYRYAILLTPFLSIISIFALQRFNFSGKNFILILILLCQVYMAFFISLNSLSHGWKAIFNVKSVPNYRLWNEANSLMEYFNDRSYKIALIREKNRWLAPFFRRKSNHQISFLRLSELKDCHRLEDLLVKNGYEVLIADNDNDVEISRIGRLNAYFSTHSSLAAFKKLGLGETLQPYISRKGISIDGWTNLNPSFRIDNWDKPFFELLLTNPTPVERKVILTSSRETKEFSLPRYLNKPRKIVNLRVDPIDVISLKISPAFIPSQHSNSLDSRSLGVRIELPMHD